MAEPKDVLIIEDDQFLSDIYKKKIEELGHTVRVASGGSEGLKEIEKSAPDLLLTDLIMPGKSGFDVLEAVSKDGKMPFPTVVLSNLGQESDKKKTAALGVKDYLVKTSVSVEDIMNKVQSFL